MARGKFAAEINRLHDEVLRPLQLVLDRNESVVYPPDLPGKVRHMTYRNQWEHYSREVLFDIRLIDMSLLQFRLPGGDAEAYSFAYVECPLKIMTYEEFLAETLELTIESARDEFWEDYSEYVGQCQPKDAVTPLRYDHSPDLYESGVHPAAHMHVGHLSEVRIGAERMMLPLSFGLFVVRQVYPDQWRTLLRSSEAKNLCRCIREHAEKLPTKFLGELDKRQLLLA